MEKDLNQQLGNLPAEILALPRWLKTRKDNHKAPAGTAWQKPENQKMYSELSGVRGFVAATEIEGGLIFYDFDHALTDSGEPVNDKAEYWLSHIQAGKFYAELSQSKHGAHMFGKPTAGKFGKINGKLYLTEDKKSFIEVFYGTTKFCLPTGNLFRCEPQAPIAQGEVANNILQNILDAINEQNSKAKSKQDQGKGEKDSTLVYQSPDSAGYDLWRATKMLDYINPEQLDYDNWFAVFTACKTIGLSYAVVDEWSRRDTTVAPNGKPRYNETENLTKWNEPINPAYNIETLAGKARDCGYNEKDSWREWCELHPEFKGKVTRRPAPMSDDDSDEREDFIWTQDRIKSCPVNLRLPANYQFGKSNITLVVPPKKPTDAPKYICVARTPIVPTKKFREPVKGTIEYEFAILSDDEWRTVEIDGGALADTRELSKVLSRHGAEINKNEYLREFLVDILSLNSAELPKLQSHNQTGWVADDYKDFAFSNNNKAVVRRQGYDYEKIFKPKGDREEWKKKFDEVVAQGGTYAKIIIGFAAAAPLLRPLELHNIQLHLHGRKSIGKTPMQKFAVSIFGDTKVGALTHTFAATPKSRLETACAFRDLPLICEELETLSKREAEKIPQDVYNYFLGIGGQALNKDGTKRDPKIFSGARLTSGEHSLIQQFGNAGEFKRVLELRCANLLEEEFAADLYPFVERNRGLFAEQWIRYIIKHHELISKNYHKAMKEITSRQKGRGNENDRTQLSTLVISAVSYQHFKICIGLSNLATDADEMSAEFEADINAIIRTLPTANEMNDTTRAVEFLKSFVAGSEKYFVHTFKNPNTGRKEDISQSTPDCYGKKFPDGRIAFLPHALKKILTDEGKGNFKSAEKIIAELADAGIIQSSFKGNPLGYAKIQGETKRVYVFEAGTISNGIDVETGRGESA